MSYVILLEYTRTTVARHAGMKRKPLSKTKERIIWKKNTILVKRIDFRDKKVKIRIYPWIKDVINIH